jgi:outer membrane protein TolC
VAAARPDPTLSLDPEHAIKTTAGDASPSYFGVTLGFTVETAGKRGLRIKQATQAQELAKISLEESLWSVRAEIRAALIARQTAERGVELAIRESELDEQLVRFASDQLQAGFGARPALLLAQAEALRAAAQVNTARNDSAAANGALAVALGLPLSGVPAGAAILLPDPHALPDPAQVDGTSLREWTVMNRLAIRRALLEYEQAQTALRIEVAKQYPDITLGPGYIYDLGTQKIALTIGSALPRRAAHQAAIEAARIDREKVAEHFDAVQARALGELDAALQRYRTAYAGVEAARVSVQRQHAATQSAQAQLQAGNIDRGEWLSARLASVQREHVVLDAERAAIDALTTVENVMQKPLWPASSFSP